MRSLATSGRSTPGSLGRGSAPGGADLFPLLRGSHLFASTVHELFHLEPMRRAIGHPLSPSQSILLRVICLNGRHPIGQVAHLLGISTPAATKTIDKLVRLGLVVRRGCKSDRRTRLFSVSPAGRDLVQRCEKLKAARLRAALKGFEPSEVDAFARLLARFSLSLLAAGPAGRGPCLRCAAYIEADCPLGRARGGCPCLEFCGTRRGEKATRSAASSVGVEAR